MQNLQNRSLYELHRLLDLEKFYLEKSYKETSDIRNMKTCNDALGRIEKLEQEIKKRYNNYLDDMSKEGFKHANELNIKTLEAPKKIEYKAYFGRDVDFNTLQKVVEFCSENNIYIETFEKNIKINISRPILIVSVLFICSLIYCLSIFLRKRKIAPNHIYFSLSYK